MNVIGNIKPKILDDVANAENNAKKLNSLNFFYFQMQNNKR